MYNSLRKIYYSRNINRVSALIRYSAWQFIKFMNLFPRVLVISKSKLIITDKESANQGGGLTYTHGLYDYNNMQLLLLLGEYDKIIYFDIGANKGIYSLLASEAVENTIYTFEPHPVTYKYLLDNIALNKRDNINTYNFALGISNDTLRFTDVAGSSTNMIVSDAEISNCIEVQVVALDSFVNEHKIVPTMMKIDVEGFENEVIKGSLSFLSKVNMLQIEISSDYNELISILHKHGFSGPYYYQHNEKKMETSKFLGCEDPIFINAKYTSFITQKLHISIC